MFLRDSETGKEGCYLGKHQEYEKRTEQLITPILEENQFELVDVEFVKEAGSWHLRAYIDKEGGITIDDLTLVNRALSDRMDEEDFIDESYILEVSSPGLSRPFKKPKDYIRNLGNDVEVKLFAPVTWEQDGKKYSDKEFIGILKEYSAPSEDSISGGKILLSFEKDDTLELEIKDIALIRRWIEF